MKNTYQNISICPFYNSIYVFNDGVFLMEICKNTNTIYFINWCETSKDECIEITNKLNIVISNINETDHHISCDVEAFFNINGEMTDYILGEDDDEPMIIPSLKKYIIATGREYTKTI